MEILEERIWGGIPDDLQSVVAIGTRNSDGSLAARCTGVALSPTQVLTAAHCAECGQSELWISDEQDVTQRNLHRIWPVDAFVRHYMFAQKDDPALPGRIYERDLALITAHDAQLTPWSRAAVADVAAPTSAKKIGYGWTANGSSARRGRRLSGTGTSKSTASSDNALRFTFDDGRSVCKYDSGGASFSLDVAGGELALVGITSSMVQPVLFPGGVQCSSVGVDENVSAYQVWIDAALAGKCTCASCTRQ